MSDTNTLNDLLPDSLNQEEQPNTQQPSLAKDDEILDMSGGFDFDNYQVVRREFFAHIKEPSVTFNECKLYVNAACLSKFPNASYAPGPDKPKKENFLPCALAKKAQEILLCGAILLTVKGRQSLSHANCFLQNLCRLWIGIRITDINCWVNLFTRTANTSSRLI